MKCLQQGFTVEKYGAAPSAPEKVIEKIVEVPVEKIVEKEPALRLAVKEIEDRAKKFSNDEHVQDTLIYMQICALHDGYKYAKSIVDGSMK